MPEGDSSVPDVIVAEKYRLTRLLGKGGMGSVYEGVHTSLGTRVAVKFIDAEYADSPEARSRFINEAKAAARLHSKHVVQVYDHGVMTDGRPYIVMEFLGGEPLDKKLDREGRLTPADVALITQHVARALTKAHEAGIVHRDLKPENVFLVWDEDEHQHVAKVVDFGIAKFTEAGLHGSSATRTGSVLGTPHYMSPEQARGLRNVDHRADIWSLGVIVYRCLTGQLPFDGEAVGDLLVKICTSSAIRPSEVAPDLPSELDGWVARALATAPEARYSSATQAADELATALGFSRVQSVPMGFTPPPARVQSDPGMGARGQLAVSAASIPTSTVAGAATSTTGGIARPASRGRMLAVLGAIGGALLLATVAVVALGGGPDREPEATPAAAPGEPRILPAAAVDAPPKVQPEVMPAEAPPSEPTAAPAPSAELPAAKPGAPPARVGVGAPVPKAGGKGAVKVGAPPEGKGKGTPKGRGGGIDIGY